MPNAPSGFSSSLLVWLFFRLKGRVSRQTYWQAYLILLGVQGAILFQHMGSAELAALMGVAEATFHRPIVFVAPLLIPLTVYMHIAVGVKRLHDMAYGGFPAVALLIPLVNFFVAIWLGLVPGTTGPNAYGRSADAPA